MSMHKPLLKAVLLLALAAGQTAAQPAPFEPWRASTPAQTHANFMALVDSMRAASARATHSKTTPPSIKSGKILTPSISVTAEPGSPELMLTIAQGDSIVSLIEIQLVSPSGQQSIYSYVPVPAYPPLHAGGTPFKIQLGSAFNSQSGFNLYSEPGAWTLNSITLATASGTPTTYDSSQLAAILPGITINVANPGQADLVAPHIAQGKILTPSVSLSSPNPLSAAQLSVSDALSGTKFVQVLLVGPNANDQLFANTLFSAPVNKGKVFAFTQVYPGTTTGTWTVFSVRYCDVAGNCGQQFGSAQIQALFGTTTFEITN